MTTDELAEVGRFNTAEIKILCMRRGVQLIKIAEDLSLHRMTVSNVVNNKRLKDFKFDLVVKIRDHIVSIFGVPLEDIMSKEDSNV
jgi:transcriptional regulator with XRE-family HTH domain